MKKLVAKVIYEIMVIAVLLLVILASIGWVFIGARIVLACLSAYPLVASIILFMLIVIVIVIRATSLVAHYVSSAEQKENHNV